MRIALVIGLTLAALVALVALAGVVLPRTHRAISRVTLAQPPAPVWSVVSDLGALLGTWKDLKSARRLADQNGKEVWEHDAGGFPMRLVIEVADPPRRLRTRIDASADAPFGGHWTYELEPKGTGTLLTVTEEGWVRNPIFRAMVYFLGPHRTVDGYLKALGTKLGETVRVEHVRGERER